MKNSFLLSAILMAAALRVGCDAKAQSQDFVSKPFSADICGVWAVEMTRSEGTFPARSFTLTISRGNNENYNVQTDLPAANQRSSIRGNIRDGRLVLCQQITGQSYDGGMERDTYVFSLSLTESDLKGAWKASHDTLGGTFNNTMATIDTMNRIAGLSSQFAPPHQSFKMDGSGTIRAWRSTAEASN